MQQRADDESWPSIQTTADFDQFQWGLALIRTVGQYAGMQASRNYEQTPLANLVEMVVEPVDGPDKQKARVLRSDFERIALANRSRFPDMSEQSIRDLQHELFSTFSHVINSANSDRVQQRQFVESVRRASDKLGHDSFGDYVRSVFTTIVPDTGYAAVHSSVAPDHGAGSQNMATAIDGERNPRTQWEVVASSLEQEFGPRFDRAENDLYDRNPGLQPDHAADASATYRHVADDLERVFRARFMANVHHQR